MVSGVGREPATVMFTDIFGYSDLTQRDEEEALRLLNEHRAIVRPILAEHGGREVKTMGDAFMVEFAAPLAAVRCALAVQRKLADRNRDPEVREVSVRIGLHSGEVLRQDGDLFGETVNVASRIEPLAPPGGVCFTAPVYEAVRSSLDVAVVPVGPATLKNIQLPVAVYCIDPRPGAHLQLRGGPWVDREAELGRLESAHAAAVAGRGQVVLISGDPGVGKSRLAEQLARLAARQGTRVLQARGEDETASSPYAVWVDLLGSLIEATSVEAVRSSAGASATELGRLVPALARPTEARREGGDADGEGADRRLFSGVAGIFREAAREAPLAVIVDDLQWADPGSVNLWARLAGELAGAPILFVATYRTTPRGTAPALERAVAKVREASTTITLPLGNLSLDGVRQLVVALLKTKATSDELVQQVFERTGGNPYFVEEVVRALPESEPSRAAGRLASGALPVPDSVRRMVHQRIDALDPTMATFLGTVAVLGSTFPLEVAGEVTGLERGTLLDRLGTAIGNRLLVERTDERGAVRYEFPEHLVWETVYADTPVARRARDHRRAAEVLEARGQAGEPISPAELAHHFQRGQDPGRALAYTVRAAEEAGRLFDREGAVQHYRAALALLETRPDERLRAGVLEALGDHLYRLGQLEPGQARRREAIDCYERLGDLHAAGNVHRKIAHAMREDPIAARQHWEEARRLLEAGPETVELARLYVTIAGYRYEEGDTGGARELYARAIDVARRVADPQTQASAVVVLSGLRPVGEAGQLLRDLDEAVALARREELAATAANLLMVLSLARLHIRGDGIGAGAALEEALEVARRSHDVYGERTIDGNLGAYLAWRLGDYDRALRTVEEHKRYASGDPHKLLPTALLVESDIALTRGEGERAARALAEADALLERGGDWSERVQLHTSRARAELRRGRLAGARAALAKAHDLSVRAGAPALMATLYAETLRLETETALREGDRPRAVEAVEALEALQREACQPPITAYAFWARGDLERRGDDLSAGTAALENATALWGQLGWGHELSQSQLQLAEAYRLDGAEERAEPLERAARGFLARVGAVPLRN